MSNGGGSKGSGSSKSRVIIPEFLKPFLEKATGYAGGALDRLSTLSGGELVADFDPIQELAHSLGIREALDGEFIPAAQQTLLKAAKGQGIEDFLDPTALAALTKAAGGQDLSSFIPAEALDALKGLSTKAGPDTSRLAALSDSSLPPEAIEALTRTTKGDYLFGGEGFNAAVDAAVRAARPYILSTFGRAGSGGASGGLSQAAVGKSAVDAFASQYANERQNQLSAANALANLNITDTGQRASIEQMIANLGLAGDSSKLSAAGALAGLGEGERGRALSAADLLGRFGDSERSRALSAAGILPEIGMAGVNLLSDIGAEKQAQEQLKLDAPIMAQLRLLSAALGGLPIESLLGSKTSGKETKLALGFG